MSQKKLKVFEKFEKFQGLLYYYVNIGKSERIYLIFSFIDFLRINKPK